MTYLIILLAKLLITTAICSPGSQHIDSTTCSKQTGIRNSTTESPPDISTSKEKVQLQVYYETLCPASVNFFVTQLKPAAKRLGAHLEVELIPYGHAKTYRYRDRYVFKCQHGPRECYGNRVHACAIDVLRNNTRALLFNTCLMQYISYQTDYDDFVYYLNWCVHAENVQITKIWRCVKSSRGRFLLKKYGDSTQDLRPSYVPYLILDGSKENPDAAGNLLAAVCKILNPKPLACRS